MKEMILWKFSLVNQLSYWGCLQEYWWGIA
jgi:hypothetical protein